jgi:hypothetical protein
MKLERMMTVEVDLPDAPAGCEWRLATDEPPCVVLLRDGESVGTVTGFVETKAPKLSHVFGEPKPLEHDTHREAAMDLFARLGLEVENG